MNVYCSPEWSDKDMSQLLDLALAGSNDVDAAYVFADAVQESRWEDGRVYGPPLYFNGAKLTFGVNLHQYYSGLHTEGNNGHWGNETIRPGAWLKDWCRACLAVMICGGWPKKWPLVDRCTFIPGVLYPDGVRRPYRFYGVTA